MRSFGLKAILRVGVLILGLVGATLAQSQGDPNKYSTTTGNSSCRFFDGFSNNGDGTITDPRNELIWKRCFEGSNFDRLTGLCVGKEKKYNWIDAIAVAKNSNYSNFNQWRLPSIEELQDVVGIKDNCFYNSLPKLQLAISQNAFPGVSPNRDDYPGWIWSFSRPSDNLSQANHLAFVNGMFGVSSFQFGGVGVVLVRDKSPSKSDRYRDFSKIFDEKIDGLDVAIANERLRSIEREKERQRMAELAQSEAARLAYENSPAGRRAEAQRQAHALATSCDGYYPGRVGHVKFRNKLLATDDKFIVRYVNSGRKMVTIEGVSGGNSLGRGEIQELSCIFLKNNEQ